ncbi:MAG: autotransporter domain-containing protein [Desulfuromonas sp.]|nr:autotransporter domain-containing protein [Desulfuromonas sp.]
MFDLRDIDGHSYIGPVRDQGYCGSCYSFGAAAAAESTYNYAHNLYDDLAVDLSESFIIWSLSTLYADFDGCDGAGYEFEELTALTESGVPFEGSFPYTTTAPGENLHWDADRVTFTDWYRIPINDIETTKRVLLEIGAVDASVFVDGHFDIYSTGNFENDYTSIDATVPYYTYTDHLISLVGWNDDVTDGGLGTWILRNSWGESWGNSGYMDIRYTSAAVLLESSYLIFDQWSGTSQHLDLYASPEVITWSSGGTLNSHGVDLWGGSASTVDNYANIIVEATSNDELTTARGVYLWGGASGRVANFKTIQAHSSSDNNQAISYAVCLQGGELLNSGILNAESQSQADQALAFGAWVANGSQQIYIANSGNIVAQAHDSLMNGAYGLWADSRSFITIRNSGLIQAQASDCAIGVLLSGGPSVLTNVGRIEASNNYTDGASAGVYTEENTTIFNSGTIKGDSYSICTTSNSELVLGSGSDLIGEVFLFGDEDSLVLVGHGSEDECFGGIESLRMVGSNWSLDGDSSFATVAIDSGFLALNGQIGGQITISQWGTLGGVGTITGDVINSGSIAPGNSIGTLTIYGDFVQEANGVFEVDVGSGVADELTVFGTAELAGNLLVLPNGYATAGSYSFIDALQIDGEFDDIISSAVLDSSLINSDPQHLLLNIHRNSYQSLSTTHNHSIALSLDRLRSVETQDSSWVLNTLDLSMSSHTLNEAMASMTPRIVGLATAMAVDRTTQRLHDVAQHFSRDSGLHNTEKSSLWLNFIGQKKTLGHDGSYQEVRESISGVMFGLDCKVTNNFTIGGAASTTKSKYNVRNSADDGDSESYSGYLFTKWSENKHAHGLQLSAVIGGGSSRMNYTRSMPFIQRSAKGNRRAYEYSALLSCGYAMSFGLWDVEPTLALSNVKLREKSFREKNAGGVNLVIDDQRSNSLQSQLAVKIGRSFQLDNLILKPTLGVEWQHKFDHQGEDINAQFSETHSSFTTPGKSLAENSFLVGLGLNAKFSKMTEFQLRYEYSQQNNRTNVGHALNAHLLVSF